MKTRIKCLLGHFYRDTHGSAAVMLTFAAFITAGLGALVVDTASIHYTQIALQASTDQAALAGAGQINVGAGGTAIATATNFSGVTGNKNAQTNLTATMATGYPQLKCLTSTGVSCAGPDSANAIVVQQTASVPLIFGGLFGFGAITVSATSTASASGGSSKPADIMVILDTTASMNNSDSQCSISGATRETCAQAGIRTLLGALSPCPASLSTCGAATNGNVANPLDRVGLMVFPGLQNAVQASYDYDCSSSTNPKTSAYNASPVYTVIPFSSDYRTSDTAGLNPNSNLVAAVGGKSGCTGIQAIGGFGTFYTDIISQAQSALATSGRPNATKVIVFVSDGGSNASASNTPSAESKNQCAGAIAAAQAATAAGTLVYSISYGSTSSTSPSDCTTDDPVISSCTTMQNIASNSTMFYSNPSGGDGTCKSSVSSLTDLLKIFQDIGVKTTHPRLIVNTTT